MLIFTEIIKDLNRIDTHVHLCSLIGKAAFLLGEYAQSLVAYNRATELNDKAQPAYKGLVELCTTTKDDLKLLDALEHLVWHPKTLDIFHYGRSKICTAFPTTTISKMCSV